MSVILKLFEQAQLAEASYSNFLFPGLAVEDALRIGGFSPAQAADFVTKYRKIDQYTAPPSSFFTTGTGFSATLFQNIETGRYTFAIRGTEPDIPDLGSADFNGIVMNGLPVFQLVEMYNYWQSLSSSGVYQAAKSELMNTESALLALLNAGRLTGAAGIAAYELYASQLKASGRILYTTLGGTQVLDVVTGPSNVLLAGTSLAQGSGKVLSSGLLDVVGHSLAGNLATAFTRLFPFVPSNAITVNGAGFPTGLVSGLGGNADSNIQNMFAKLSGSSFFDSSKIYNIHGSGPNFVTMNSRFGLVQQGSTQEIFIEKNDASVLFGHKANQMTDTLAMYDLFASLDSTLKTASLSAVNAALISMFKAASTKPASSIERLLDGLVKFLGLDFPQLLDMDFGATAREEVFKRIVELRQSITTLAGSNPGMRVDVLATTTAATLTNLAQGSAALAYRYALKELNPFAITGRDNLYSLHNQNRELDIYNAAERDLVAGALTTDWIEDRAAFLATKNIANTKDTGQFDSRNIVISTDIPGGARRYIVDGAYKARSRRHRTAGFTKHARLAWRSHRRTEVYFKNISIETITYARHDSPLSSSPSESQNRGAQWAL